MNLYVGAMANGKRSNLLHYGSQQYVAGFASARLAGVVPVTNRLLLSPSVLQRGTCAE